MPVPVKGEKKTKFLARCMKMLVEEGKDEEQSFAICSTKWEEFDAVGDLDVKELSIDLDKGIDKISLVDKPAVEVDFLYFNKNEEKLQLSSLDNDKHIITGPAMIPDKLIFRINEKTKEKFYIYFTEETVRQTAELYLKQFKQDNVNIDHKDDVNNVYLFESWIVEDPENDKSKALGFDVPKGTWMISMKVDNTDVWNNLVKEHEVNGFSIEGTFLSNFKAIEKAILIRNIPGKLTDQEIVELIQELLS